MIRFILLQLLLIIIVKCQILVNIDDSNPNLVIADMNHNNITIAVSIPYSSSATIIAVDICLSMENIRNERFEDFYECVDDVGQKVLYGRVLSNYSTNILYHDNNDQKETKVNVDIDNNDQKEIRVNANINNNDISLISKRNQQAIERGVSIAPSNIMCSSRHNNIDQEIMETALYQKNPMKSRYNGIGAIVILAQAGQHSTYTGFNALNELKKTLNLLYKNYNDDQKDDIWIFHEGDFTKDIQIDVRANRSEIRFFHLKDENWSVYPKYLENRTSSRSQLSYSLGYRLMIRWYAIRIWHVMAMMGYTWILRLDDDSGILSPIKFNIFGFMEKYGYQYAYRVVAVESPHSLFYDFLISHVIKNNITNISQMMDVCETKETLADFNVRNCGLTPGNSIHKFFRYRTKYFFTRLLHKFFRYKCIKVA